MRSEYECINKYIFLIIIFIFNGTFGFIIMTINGVIRQKKNIKERMTLVHIFDIFESEIERDNFFFKLCKKLTKNKEETELLFKTS